jgi:hypothetical protein
MSKRYFRFSGGFKKKNPAGFDSVPEVGVADGARLDQVDRDLQDGFEVLLQPEEMLRPIAGRHWFELHEQVDVAALPVERRPQRGAKDRKPPHAVALAQPGNVLLPLTQ